MYAINKYIRFNEEGESFICRRGKIKQNTRGKLYLEVWDVPGLEGKHKIKINDYISNTLQNTRCAYVNVICKDVDKQFVDIREADVENSFRRSYSSHVEDDDLVEYIDRRIEENEEDLERLYRLREIL